MTIQPTLPAVPFSVSPRRRSPFGAVAMRVCLWLALGLSSLPLVANDLDLTFLGQSPPNPVLPSTEIVYQLRTRNVSDGINPPSSIGVGLEVLVDGVQIPANSFQFVTSDCSIDQSFPSYFACNNLQEGGSQTVRLTWNNPDPGTSTVSFRGSCQLVPVQVPPVYCRSFGITVQTTTVVQTASVQFATGSSSIGEGQQGATLSVLQTNPTGAPVSVQYAVSGGSATAGSDYRLSAGTLVWGQGDSSPRSILVTVLEDALAEGDETVVVSLSNPSGAILGSPSSTTLVIVDNDEPVIADFTWTPQTPTAGSPVQFTDQSTGPVTSWSWSFGDGQGSSSRNPTHMYSQPGDYFVQLTATGTSGSSIAQRSITVSQAPQPPTASFSWSPQNPRPGQAVQFTDQSTGTFSAWSWSFGDGQGSQAQNARHTYSAPGNYRVGLTVSGQAGSSTAQRTVTVAAASQPPEADFTFSPLNPSSGQLVQFTDRSTGDVDSWDWSFGDGTFSAAASPSHTYSTAGTYNVTLAVAGPAGASSRSRTLHVIDTATVEFTAGVVAGSEGDDVLIVPVRRLGSSSYVQVTVTAVGGSATAGRDFTFPRQILVWQEHEQGLKEARITLRDDVEVELIETLELQLTGAVGATVGRALCTAVIQDNDFVTHPEETVSDDTTSRRPVTSTLASPGPGPAFQILVWEEDDGRGSGIFARIVDAEGSTIVPTFRVNADRRGDQTNPRVVADGSGDFAVLWQEFPEGTSALSPRGAGGSLWGQFFDPLGETKGPEITVSSLLSGVEAEAATDSLGHALVAWESGGQILSQEISVDGLFGPATVLGQGLEPKIARIPTGNFAVVFRPPAAASLTVQPRGAAGSDLLASFFGPDGQELAKGVPLDEDTVGTAALAAAGDFFIVTYATRQNDNDVDIFAALLELDGTNRVPAFRVNKSRQGEQRSPSVGVNSSGDFVIAWESDDGVSARFFNRRAKAVGGDLQVAEARPSETPASPRVSIDDDDVVRVVWERRLANGANNGVGSKVIEPNITSGCTIDDSTLCLQGELFEVQVQWRTASGANGRAHAVPLTQDTGYFWFFDQANVEMLIKVLDGCGVNDRFWVFAGGLTDVETIVVVTDTVTGRTHRYRNPMGTAFQPVQDTGAFSSCHLSSTSRFTPSPASVTEAAQDFTGEWVALSASLGLAPRATCVPNSRRLCLNGGRYAVEAEWNTDSSSGHGRAVRLTGDTGYFWFFDQANVEMVVKVLDACSFSNHVWVFAGGLTNVAVEWSVTDTRTGTRVDYNNPLSTTFRPLQDTAAFSSCP